MLAGDEGGIREMPRMRPVLLVACLLAAMTQGCSMGEPKPRDFTLTDQRPAKAQEAGNTLEAAEAICRAETKRKGIANVAAIFSRLRQGSADEDYIACMKARGYEVKP
jgi:hypothetical protein